MNILDWIVMVIAICGLVIGYQRGLIGQLISLAGLIVAYIVAYSYYKEISVWVQWFIPWPQFDEHPLYGFAIKETDWEMYLNHAVAFVFLFIVVKLACSLIGAIINIIFKAPGLNLLNKWTGALLGFGGSVILIVVGISVIGAIPAESLQKQLHESKTNQYIQEYMPKFIPPLHNESEETEDGQIEI